MKSVRKHWNSVTENASSDMVELNGRYTAVQFDSMRDDSKWAINKGDIPLFDDFGVIPGTEDVIVGNDRGSLYLIKMSNNPKPISKAKTYRAFESNEFIWIMGSRGDLSDPIIPNKGKYLVHLPTERHIRCEEPPKMTKFRKKFETSNEVIRWNGSQFEKQESKKQEGTSDKEINIEDARKDELEEYLRDNVDLDIVKGASNIDEVDMRETPSPIVEVFYDMGEGEFPEDENGDFEPPGQDEFAYGAYNRFKKMSDNDKAFCDENREAWVKRLKNAWASLVRDVHFSFMMYQEQNNTECFDRVEFDKEKDVEEGIDFLIENDGTEYHVNLFIDSKKSRRFLEKKKKYRQPDTDQVAVEVPMKFRGNKKKSINTNGRDLWLYSEDHIDAIKDVVFNDKDKVKQDGITLCEKMGYS